MSEEMLNTESHTADKELQGKRSDKSLTRWIVIALISVAAILFGVFIAKPLFISGVANPYEKDYIDVTGRTAADLAEEKGMEYDKFLAEYGLPADMPKSTSERAVYYNIPVGVMVEKMADVKTFDELKELMGWGDEITESTTMGDALDVTKLSYYVGEDQLDKFKSLYGLSDAVTGDTLYSQVRNIVDAKDKEYTEAASQNNKE